MGVGHHVDGHGDFRVPVKQDVLDCLVSRAGGPEAVRMATVHAALRRAMISRKDINPNLDYPAGFAYHLLGFDIPVFTPVSRLSDGPDQCSVTCLRRSRGMRWPPPPRLRAQHLG